ncbi:MAG: hypothetical protein ABIH74_00180 [Candidatus Omnitrophota bacterium]
MEMELKSIIEKIKEEGVGEAEKEARAVITAAEEKAAGIIRTAAAEKEAIVARAGSEAARMRKNGESAVRQAARDILLGLKEDISKLFDAVMKKEIAEQLSATLLRDMILCLAEKFNPGSNEGIEVLVSKKDIGELEKMLLTRLKERMAKGVTLKSSPAVEKGFRIGEKNGNAYYDFTDEAIMEAFKTFLNPRIREVLGDGGK